jgi:hypothetical protein
MVAQLSLRPPEAPGVCGLSKTGAFFPPPLSVERLSTPSVTKFQAKSPPQKQRELGLQRARGR